MSKKAYARTEAEEDLRLFTEAESRLSAHKDSDILDEDEVIRWLGLSEAELQSAPCAAIE